jgi:hypothetical protein
MAKIPRFLSSFGSNEAVVWNGEKGRRSYDLTSECYIWSTSKFGDKFFSGLFN